MLRIKEVLKEKGVTQIVFTKCLVFPHNTLAASSVRQIPCLFPRWMNRKDAWRYDIIAF